MASTYIPYSDVYNGQSYTARDRRDAYDNEYYRDQNYGTRDQDYEANDRDYRTPNRSRSRSRVQYAPGEDIEEVRRQQWEAFNRPGAERRDLNDQNLMSHRRESDRNWARDRSADDAYYSRRYPRRQNTYSEGSESGSDDQSRHRRQQSTRRNGNNALARRAKSESRQSDQSLQSRTTYDGDYKSLVDRNLDLSPNGALVAALGAGVGAIAARRFGPNHFKAKEGSNANWATVGGALVGGVAANAAEKQWRKRRESKKVGQESRGEEE